MPIFNDDGSVKLTQLVSPEEAKALLQFAINFHLAVGNSAILSFDGGQQELNFDD